MTSQAGRCGRSARPTCRPSSPTSTTTPTNCYVAASDADWAEDDAAAAIDFAAWCVDNARYAVLDAIDARAYANELAQTVGR